MVLPQEVYPVGGRATVLQATALPLHSSWRSLYRRSTGRGGRTQVAGLQSSVLTGGALSVVLIAHHDPGHVCLLVGPAHVRNSSVLARQLVLDAVDLHQPRTPPRQENTKFACLDSGQVSSFRLWKKARPTILGSGRNASMGARVRNCPRRTSAWEENS